VKLKKTINKKNNYKLGQAHQILQLESYECNNTIEGEMKKVTKFKFKKFQKKNLSKFKLTY
jgi:hypothetical protein